MDLSKLRRTRLPWLALGLIGIMLGALIAVFGYAQFKSSAVDSAIAQAESRLANEDIRLVYDSTDAPAFGPVVIHEPKLQIESANVILSAETITIRDWGDDNHFVADAQAVRQFSPTRQVDTGLNPGPTDLHIEVTADGDSLVLHELEARSKYGDFHASLDMPEIKGDEQWGDSTVSSARITAQFSDQASKMMSQSRQEFEQTRASLTQALGNDPSQWPLVTQVMYASTSASMNNAESEVSIRFDPIEPMPVGQIINSVLSSRGTPLEKAVIVSVDRQKGAPADE